MGLPSATLTERITRIQQDINARLPGADAGIKRTVEHALAHAIGAATHGLQGVGQWIEANVVPGPDSDEETLERWLDLLGIPRKQPTLATGTVRFTGIDSSTIVAGTEVQKADGTLYTTDALGTISGGVADVAITAAVAAEAGDAAIGTTLTLVSPVAGVDAGADVLDNGSGGGLTGGNDLETAGAMWIRVNQRLANPPGPGTEADFERWALEVAGVTQAWADGSQPLGPGTVRVLFVRDDDADGPIPDASEVSAVQAHVDSRRPPTMITTVAAPAASALAWTIDSLVVDPTSGLTLAQTQANILAQRDDYLLRFRKPNTTLRLEDMIQAIRTAFGVLSFELTSPAADVTITPTQIPTGGTISYT